MKVLITGATGLIGHEIGKRLAEKNHEIFVISRDIHKAQKQLPFPATVIQGDLSKAAVQDERLQGIRAVIHLAGEPVAGGRWSEDRKRRIYDSRIRGTENLMKSLPQAPEVIVASSAVGYYGDRGSEGLGEEAAPGRDFLAKVCVDWEKAVGLFSCRKVFIRTGVVLSREGGALSKMLWPFRIGVGGPIGSGEQWMSWIHIEDLVNIFVWALENKDARGAYNGVAPHPVTNREFSQVLAKSLGRPLGPPVPAFMLKLLFGEMAQVILASQKVSAQKLNEQKFLFLHPDLEPVLQTICQPYREGEDEMYAEQFVAASPEEVFPFFSEATNLEKITPDSLNFHIKSMSTAEIQEGTLIDYKLKIHGIPAGWRTEIQEWKPPFKFVDNQLKGPYKLWHHTHEFKSFAGGTLLTDRVRYKLPLGYLGWLIAGSFVRKDVEAIFAHRREYIAKKKF